MPASSRLLSAVPDARLAPDSVDELFQDEATTSDVVTRSGMAVIEVDLATLRIVAVSDPAAAMVVGDRRDIVGREVADFVADEPTGALPLLATGRLDGFETQRRVRRTDGEVISAYVWAHVLGEARPARYGAAFLVPDHPGEPGSLRVAEVDADQRIIGTVDGQWRIDRISAETESLLGYPAGQLAGAALLAAVSPHDVPELLAGLAHVHATGRTAVVRLRIRRMDGQWLWCRAHLAAMGEPPRFAFTLRPLSGPDQPQGDRVIELESRLARIAHEVRAVGLRVPSGGVPVLSDLPELATLTSREWETLSLLSDGARVPSIAATLGLSQSTVRNHLSAIFRKIEVGSQAELMARLRPGAPAR